MARRGRPNVTELAKTPDFMRYLWVATLDGGDSVYYSTGSTWIRLRTLVNSQGIMELKFIDLADDEVYVVNPKIAKTLLDEWRDNYFEESGFSLKPYLLN